VVVEGGMGVVTQQLPPPRGVAQTAVSVLTHVADAHGCLQCRLPGSGGTWMVVEGGMGVVTQQLAARAMAAGAAIHTASPVKRVEVQGGQATGVCVKCNTSKGVGWGVCVWGGGVFLCGGTCLVVEEAWA
jgi:hypothetical protein